MPLARYALYAQGVQIYVAPTWDRGEPWISTLRHIAKEGRVYVVAACSAMRRADIPDRFSFKARFLSGGEMLLSTGMELTRVSPPARRAYLHGLAKAGVRALGLELVQWVREVPSEILDAAHR